ncbi:MAG: cupredoxin domain-containing protein [Sphingomonas bacterium]|nr:cupredoxin domain-containing protein [Sphingomonas bacterium]
MKRFFFAAFGSLLMLTAPAAAAPRTSVTITLTSHRYTPSPIYLAGGVPVRLILQNRGGKDHDFSAAKFFRSSRLVAGRAPSGEVRLGPGQSAIIDLIPVRGSYKVHCGEFGHKLLGMSTMIIVL